MVVVHPRSTDATVSICACVGVAGSFASALLIFTCSLATAWSQRSSGPVSGPVGAALGLTVALGLGAALWLAGPAGGVLDDPLHPARHATTADAALIIPLQERGQGSCCALANLAPSCGACFAGTKVPGIPGALTAARSCLCRRGVLTVIMASTSISQLTFLPAMSRSGHRIRQRRRSHADGSFSLMPSRHPPQPQLTIQVPKLTKRPHWTESRRSPAWPRNCHTAIRGPAIHDPGCLLAIASAPPPAPRNRAGRARESVWTVTSAIRGVSVHALGRCPAGHTRSHSSPAGRSRWQPGDHWVKLPCQGVQRPVITGGVKATAPNARTLTGTMRGVLPRVPGCPGQRSGQAVADLLQDPGVAVRVGEVGEAGVVAALRIGPRLPAALPVIDG